MFPEQPLFREHTGKNCGQAYEVRDLDAPPSEHKSRHVFIVDATCAKPKRMMAGFTHLITLVARRSRTIMVSLQVSLITILTR